MNRVLIRCLTCQQSWSMEMAYTIYEQQSLESSPCPQCGSYTLCCADPASTPAPKRRRRPTGLPSGVIQPNGG